MRPTTPGGGQQWGSKMWRILNEEMSLEGCSMYSYEPEEDPYDEEEASIWSLNYFFFNKAKKRVCYLYVRGLSLNNQGLGDRTPVPTSPRTIDLSWANLDSGAGKRAKYWLGDRVVGNVIGGWNDDEEDEGGHDSDVRVLTDSEASRYSTSFEDSPSPTLGRGKPRGKVPGMDDDIADSIEV